MENNRELQGQQGVLGHTVFFHLEILLWGFGMFFWAPGIPSDTQPLTSLAAAPSALPHPRGQLTPHSFDELLGTTIPFPWEKSIL